MGKTLWEMLSAKAKGPIELQVTNPLKVKLGTSLSVNEIDLKGLSFYVKRIAEYKRAISGTEFTFTDYDLLARPLGKEEVRVKLRLNPMANPDEAAGLTHNVVVLKLYDELAYTEDFHKVVTATTKQFEVTGDDGACAEHYWRINDVQESYKAEVTFVNEEKAELQKSRCEYWDFWREVKDEANQKYLQYMFIEMDTENGWFQLWRGAEIDAQQVTVL